MEKRDKTIEEYQREDELRRGVSYEKDESAAEITDSGSQKYKPPVYRVGEFGEDGRYYFYSTFWTRLLAFIVDQVILSVVVYFIAYYPCAGDDSYFCQFRYIQANAYFYGILINWLYNAILECSSYQGSIGKILVGLKVTDINGERVSFVQASIRHFSKIVSGLILGIGYLFIFFTKKKQALHDLMANTLVVKGFKDVDIKREEENVISSTTSEDTNKGRRSNYVVIFILSFLILVFLLSTEDLLLFFVGTGLFVVYLLFLSTGSTKSFFRWIISPFYKLPKNSFIFFIVLLIFGFAFYWFAWRPSDIKRFCSDVASEAMDRYKSCPSRNNREKESCLNDYYDEQYVRCLRENGL